MSMTEQTTTARKAAITPWWSRRVDRIVPYVFIAPFLISFLILFIGPALFTVIISFFRYPGYGSASWTGLGNYRAMLTYKVFWGELGNTVFYWVAHVSLMMIFAFGLALIFHSKVIPHIRIFKPIIFLPQIVAAAAASLIFRNFFGSEYGVLNHLLGTNIGWLTDMQIARWAVVIMLVWRGTAYWFVVYLAGLTTINPEVLEAATVDGASAWQRIIQVTIPLMRNTFLFAFVVSAISSFRLFTEPNVLVGTMGSLAPVDVAPILNSVVQSIRDARFGAAAAVGWLVFVLIAAVSFVQFRILAEEES